MLLIDRKKVPEARQVEFLMNIEPGYLQLSNGIPVYMIDQGNQEVLRIELIFMAGSYYQKHKHVARATNSLLAGGTSSYSAEELSEHFDYYGAHLEVNNTRDNAYVGLYTLNKHLQHTLPMLAEVVLNPVFPDHEIDIYRSTRKEHLNINRQKVKYLAKVYFHEQVFGSTHPYGIILLPEHIDELQREILTEHHRNHYRVEDCTIIVSGKIPDGIENLLDKYFGGCTSGSSKVQGTNMFTINPSDEKVRFIQKKDSTQAAIRIGKPTINRQHSDFQALSVVNTILGGYFGSRLMKNIREDKGYTYGIHSALVSLHRSGMFVIASEVGNHALEAAISEIYKEIRILCDVKVRTKELSLVKNYLMGTLMRSMDGPFEIAERLRTALEFGQDLNYYNRYIQTIREISPVRIQELANEYLQGDSMFQTIAGNEKA